FFGDGRLLGGGFSGRGLFGSRSGFLGDGFRRRGFLGHGLGLRRRRRGGGRGGGGLGAVGLALGALGRTLLGLLAGLALVWVVAVRPFHQALGGQEASHPVGGLGALLQPFLDALDLQHHPLGAVLGDQRVVRAHLLD